MANLQSVPKEPESGETPDTAATGTLPIWQWLVGAVLVVALGSWLAFRKMAADTPALAGLSLSRIGDLGVRLDLDKPAT